MKNILLYFLISFTNIIFATIPNFNFVNNIEVRNYNNNILKNAFAGGLNTPQFGKADMNNDGKKDVIVFDKTNQKWSIFINTGSNNNSNYIYNRYYEKNLPLVNSWFVLKNYNCDAIEDFFTYNGNGSVAAYIGYYNGNELQFKLQQNKFLYQSINGTINAYNSVVDKPAFVDINNDGDLDFASFNVSGNRILYYENLQKELNLTCDSLFFKIQDRCFGNILENANDLGVTIGDTCTNKFAKISSPNNLNHVGSTLEITDVNGDGKQDILLGDVTGNFINYLKNIGTIYYASFINQDTLFPFYNEKIRLNYFPLANSIDITNDNKNDLIVSSFEATTTSNFDNILYYKNTSNTDSMKLELQTKNFLTDEMIEVGENASPCFFDYNNDGLQDIIIGNTGYNNYTQTPFAQLHLYQNTGTPTTPIFKLIDSNYLHSKNLQQQDFIPNIGDIDNDLDNDLIIGCRNGTIFWYENTAGNLATPHFILRGNLKDINNITINIGQNAAPFLADLNKDNQTDLIVGTRAGILKYYQKTSNGFQLINDTLGKIKIGNPNIPNNYTVPFFTDLNNDNKVDLILGTNTQNILFYDNIEDKLNNIFVVEGNLLNTRIGYRNTISFANMMNDAKPELLVGNIAGGLYLLSLDAVTPIKNNQPKQLDISIYPNPTSNKIVINNNSYNKNFTLKIYDNLGKEIFVANKEFLNNETIDLSNFANGIYFIQIYTNTQSYSSKLIINK